MKVINLEACNLKMANLVVVNVETVHPEVGFMLNVNMEVFNLPGVVWAGGVISDETLAYNNITLPGGNTTSRRFCTNIGRWWLLSMEPNKTWKLL